MKRYGNDNDNESDAIECVDGDGGSSIVYLHEAVRRMWRHDFLPFEQEAMPSRVLEVLRCLCFGGRDFLFKTLPEFLALPSP